MSSTVDEYDRIVRERELLRLTGLSRSTIFRLERMGKFPQRRKIAVNAVGWIYSEVHSWICGDWKGAQ